MVVYKYLPLLCVMLISSCSIFRIDPDACLKCHGSGRIHKPCASCNSTGRCRRCNGTGFIRCPLCINGYKYIDEKRQKCSTCQGKGNFWRSCKLCSRGRLYGTGKCHECRSEYYICPICDGTGKKTNIDSYENK